MNKKLNMAVASAVLAMGASAAQAGITIPAGDWTIDIGGNVNAYYVSVSGDADDRYGSEGALVAGAGEGDFQNIRTGLLPSALGIGGKTRQNDLDVAFQFTFFVGADDGGQLSSLTGDHTGSAGAGGGNTINIRQAYGSFGDKSWGTIKFGRDLGIFGSDAILSDMTLLGVGGGGAGVGGSSTLGRIGNGYLYADWVGQISYASPNWNGFSFAVGARDPWSGDQGSDFENDTLGFEGKVQYEWGGDVSGKVWAGYIHQKFDDIDQGDDSYDADAWEIGGKIAVAGFGFVANYQDGEGQGDALFGVQGSQDGSGNLGETDSTNWYVQGTYSLPNVGTKIGLSYGETELEKDGFNDMESESWIVGIYHPLTKSLNLVAEYTDIESKDALDLDADSQTFAVGAIMFF